MRKNHYNDLRSRAEKIQMQCRNSKSGIRKDVSDIINELTLYQIELEVQNEDLTKALAELEESRSKYTELYDLAPAGYFCINQEGLIKDINQAGCLLLGLKKQALINRCFSRYIAAEHQTLFSQYRRQAFKEKSHLAYELKLIRWNKPSFYASCESKVIVNEQSGHEQLLMFVTDISSRKQEEDELHQQRIKMASIDRLRSITELVYGIAQDQDNSLLMMENYLQGCIRRLESKTYQEDELISALKKASNYSRTIAKTLLSRKTISSKSVFHYVTANINTVIKKTISLLNHEITGFPVTVQYTEPENTPKIKLDLYHMQQAFLNIARNAIEAMRDSKIQEPKLLIEIIESKEQIEVTLFDNGPGITQDSISKLFEPHFTTKPYAVGLGLTVSRAIIERHGGQLFAATNPSGGACIGFTLPCITT